MIRRKRALLGPVADMMSLRPVFSPLPCHFPLSQTHTHRQTEAAVSPRPPISPKRLSCKTSHKSLSAVLCSRNASAFSVYLDLRKGSNGGRRQWQWRGRSSALPKMLGKGKKKIDMSRTARKIMKRCEMQSAQTTGQLSPRFESLWVNPRTRWG